MTASGLARYDRRSLDRWDLACFLENYIIHNCQVILSWLSSKTSVEDGHQCTVDGPHTVISADGGHISMRYKEYVDILMEDKTDTLVPHLPIKHAIDLVLCFNLPESWICSLSDIKIETIKVSKTNINPKYESGDGHYHPGPKLKFKSKTKLASSCVSTAKLWITVLGINNIPSQEVGDAWPVMQDSDHYTTGTLKYISFCSNSWCWWVQNGFYAHYGLYEYREMRSSICKSPSTIQVCIHNGI